jgi:DNA-binding transcriptional ArsR family regulator
MKKTNLFDNAAIKSLSELITAVANSQRQYIIQKLIEQGEVNVNNIVKLSKKDFPPKGFSQPVISNQLAILRKFSLVDFERRGKEIYYSANIFEIEKVKKLLQNQK